MDWIYKSVPSGSKAAIANKNIKTVYNKKRTYFIMTYDRFYFGVCRYIMF